MLISTKGRYGLRAMVDLAMYSNSEQVSLSSIAERQKISAHYLEQVFALLKKGGLVKSVKGSQGGYILAKKPVDITVGAVLRVLEGNLNIVDDTDSKNSQDSIEYCLTLNVWDKLNESINSIVDSITLEDLINKYKTLNINLSLMAYI
ncbi:MAG TPA: Rrf2 family transcriptional regulator [Syntrophomonadaceae bacterium]|nr:Rrf2 family transcriptional regulator [Syntrophomonadaceae bacterium]